MTSLCTRPSPARLGRQPERRRLGPASLSAGCRRPRVVTVAVSPATVELAVAQQEFFLALVIGAEAGFQVLPQGLDVPVGTPGRPALIPLGATVGGLIVSAALTLFGPTAALGLAGGAAACVSALAQSVVRVVATPQKASDWPGAKSWPILAATASGLVAVAAVQGLVSVLGSS